MSDDSSRNDNEHQDGREELEKRDGEERDIVEDVMPPEQVHMLAGAPGAGKTAFTFWLLSQIRDGYKVFGLKTRKPKFIGYLACDRRWESHERWARLLRFEDIPHYSVVDDTKLSLEKVDSKKTKDHVEFLYTLICRINDNTPPPRDSLIVVDPLALFLGPEMIRYQSVYRHMVEISQMLMEHGWTMLGLAHAAKQKGDKGERYVRPQDRILGSAALIGCAGTVMYLATPEETEGGENPEFTWAPHHAPMMTVALKRNAENGVLTPWGSYKKEAEGPSGRVINFPKPGKAAMAFLEKFTLDEAGSELRELVQAEVKNGAAQPTVYRYKDQLAKAGLIEKVKNGWYRRVGEESVSDSSQETIGSVEGEESAQGS